MTAGSYMYIGPQGIVHGTTITVMNAFRKHLTVDDTIQCKVFLTSGLGGMSGAQPKAGNIAGCITVCAEINPAAARKRHEQGWVDRLVENIDELVEQVQLAMDEKETISFAYIGNIVEVWEAFDRENIHITVGSDQTSLHNPWSGGYYPMGLTFAESNALLATDPDRFKRCVQESLVRHVDAINKHVAKGTYFFDYGNAFLLESSRAGAAVWNDKKDQFRYPSYVQDILGPMCFDYGFGPFRWVCTSGKASDLQKSDEIAMTVLEELRKEAPVEIQQQMQDNIQWIKEAGKNRLVVGSQARILYADSNGRIAIAKAFNEAVKSGLFEAPIVLGRDHHDVSGTDSPYRETSNIYDGSQFTADMAIHNVIGDSFRGATWVSIHNGGGVGWGEVINGGFGLLLDGSAEAAFKLEKMLYFDVNNGIARRAWARNKEANQALDRAMEKNTALQVTRAQLVDDDIIEQLFDLSE
jgi:urocanate hydratase